MIEKIRELINNTLDLNIGELTNETSFIGDLELDSMDLVELLPVFEEEFGLEIEDKDIKNLQTVGDLLKYIETYSA